MGRAIYTEKKNFVRFDSKRFMAYLNEEILEDYVVPTDFDSEPSDPVTAYAYTGTEKDGGTLIQATCDDRDSLINGIIRSKYSQSEEDAIKTHQIIVLQNPQCEKLPEYNAEWTEFNAFRESAIQTVDRWFE